MEIVEVICSVCYILGLDMNGTHQVLAYADDVNLTGDDNITKYHDLQRGSLLE